MIGDMIKNIRKSKKMSLKQIADITGIDIGHLSHIEKGERNPSYKALSAICSALEVSVTQFVGSIGKQLNEEQEEYGYIKYVPYNKAPLVNILEYVDIPKNYKENIMAVIVPDNSMDKLAKKGDHIYIGIAQPVNNKDIGLFSYNGQILIREFNYSINKIKLKAYNKDYKTITVKDDDEFYIIGKMINE